ncbi:tetratricopeptide repeat protein [Roseibium algae]|uniref:Tetratricopeptide repeat protein n=1 Tax=Roseibium algae TaxID=3123038 RepID=A0ABU8TFY7_9HYPH
MLAYSRFLSLIKKVTKNNLFDAVHPEILAFANNKHGTGLSPDVCHLIMMAAYEAIGSHSAPPNEDFQERIRDMKKRRADRPDEYRADAKYGHWFYYYSLFSADDPHYGERISQKLFGRSFYDEFVRDMIRLGIPRPSHLPPVQIARLGPISISLGSAANLQPLKIDQHFPATLTEDGIPNVYAALHWRARLSILLGRSEEHKRLMAWALDDTSNRAKVMLISGPGGSGKTRLAAHVVTRLVHDEDKLWHGDFLPSNLDGAVYNGAGNGVALIIDYPEERTAEVKAILKSAAEGTEYDRPIRIILVSRQDRQSWLKILNDPGYPNFEETRLEAKPYLDFEDAETIAHDVMENYPGRIGRRGKIRAKFLPDWLNYDPVHRLPLNVVAASVHAVLFPDRAFSLNDKEVLSALADFELRRVRSYSERDLGRQNALEKLLALSLLTPTGLGKDTIHELGESGICEGKTGNHLLEAVQATPFWRKPTATQPGHLVRIEPDLPAAAFLTKALNLNDPPPGLAGWMAPAAAEAKEDFGDILARVIADIASFDVEAGRAVEQVSIAMLDTQPKLLTPLYRIAYRPTSTFSAKFVVALCDRLLALNQPDPTRAALLLRKANALIAHGANSDALSVIEEGIDRFQALDGDGNDEIHASLGLLYRYQCNALYKIGHLEHAEWAIYDSAQYFEKLFRKNPERYAEDYAATLDTFAAIYTETERLEKAVSYSAEAIRLLKEVDRLRPGTVKEAIGVSSLNQNRFLLQAGRHEQALEAIGGSIEIFKELSEGNGSRYKPMLIQALLNRGATLDSIGSYDKSLDALREAGKLCEPIAALHPVVFRPQLALIELNRSYALMRLERFQEAIVAAKEAEENYRSVLGSSGDATNWQLAQAMNNKATAQYLANLHDDAVLTVNEALELFPEKPDVPKGAQNIVSGMLADFLHLKAVNLFALTKVDSALVANAEAVATLEKLQAAEPERHIKKLCAFQEKQCEYLVDLNRVGDAHEIIVSIMEKAQAFSWLDAEWYRKVSDRLHLKYMQLCQTMAVPADSKFLRPPAPFSIGPVDVSPPTDDFQLSAYTFSYGLNWSEGFKL